MASNAFSGVGTVFKIDTATVAEVNSIAGPNITRSVIDVTSLDSTDGYREYIGGFRDGGELTLNMNFTRDTYDDFKDLIELDESETFSIELPDTGTTTFTITGWVTGVSMAVPFDDKVTSDVSIKIDGPVTMAS